VVARLRAGTRWASARFYAIPKLPEALSALKNGRHRTLGVKPEGFRPVLRSFIAATSSGISQRRKLKVKPAAFDLDSAHSFGAHDRAGALHCHGPDPRGPSPQGQKRRRQTVHSAAGMGRPAGLFEAGAVVIEGPPPGFCSLPRRGRGLGRGECFSPNLCRRHRHLDRAWRSIRAILAFARGP